MLFATVRSYVPLSGNAFLLDAIGATFIGTTISPTHRPSVLGTLLGVLLLGMVRNGLLLLGCNFYWQQVGTGLAATLAATNAASLPCIESSRSVGDRMMQPSVRAF